MDKEVHGSPKTSKRTVAAAVSASLALVLLMLGLAFANSVGAAQVADNARALHWANATIGTSALTRAALAQAVTFASLHHSESHFGELGEEEGHYATLVLHEDVEFATFQLATSLGELRSLHGLAGASPSSAHLWRFITPVSDALEALGRGEVDHASELLATQVETAYMGLVDSLQEEQDAIQVSIDENTRSASRLNGLAVFFLMLVLPGAAVLVYWWIARRQLREYRIKSESELAAERAISAAKDSFVAGLSHELRTPLTSIYGFSEILTDGGVDDPEQSREVAQIIANEAAEMTRMVDDLLTASRLESTGIEIDVAPTRLRDIVESAVTPFERAGMVIQKDLGDVVTMTDGARLRHILINLVSNAVRHGGESIGITLGSGESTVDIEVWDSGDGVSEEKRDKLFQRFVHDDSEPMLTGSVGLGLAVASRLAAMLDGSISYQRYGEMTYFTVQLPLTDVTDPEADQEPSVRAMIRSLTQ